MDWTGTEFSEVEERGGDGIGVETTKGENTTREGVLHSKPDYCSYLNCENKQGQTYCSNRTLPSFRFFFLSLESTAFRLIHGLGNHVLESCFTKHDANLVRLSKKFPKKFYCI